MRTVNTELVESYADDIRPLLPLARRAYGTQKPGSPAREASDKVNALIREYVDDKGGNVTHLATALEDDDEQGLSLAGLRRRLRVARAGQQLGDVLQTAGRTRGSKDPEKVAAAAKRIQAARGQGSESYGDAVRKTYADKVSLSAVADEMSISYYALWSAARTG